MLKKIQSIIFFLLRLVVFISLCSMVLVAVVDAVGRYFFSRPITGSTELIELLMILVIFGSIPLVTYGRAHIKVDFFPMNLKKTMGRIHHGLIELICAAINFLLVYATWDKVQSLLDYGDTTQMLSIPLAPFVVVIMVMLAVNGLIHLGLCFQFDEGAKP